MLKRTEFWAFIPLIQLSWVIFLRKKMKNVKNIKALKLNKLTHLAALKKVKSIIGESLDQYKVFSMFFELPKTM